MKRFFFKKKGSEKIRMKGWMQIHQIVYYLSSFLGGRIPWQPTPTFFFIKTSPTGDIFKLVKENIDAKFCYQLCYQVFLKIGEQQFLQIGEKENIFAEIL